MKLFDLEAFEKASLLPISLAVILKRASKRKDRNAYHCLPKNTSSLPNNLSRSRGFR